MRRRAGAARFGCARAANSVAALPRLLALVGRAVYVAALLDDRSINRKMHALIDGKRARPAHAWGCALLVSYAASSREVSGAGLRNVQKRPRVGRCCSGKTRPAPASDESATRKRGAPLKKQRLVQCKGN